MTIPFTELLDLASERLGGAVLHANDEFFAPKENLLRAKAPVWLEHEYTDRGKWMDGWETRRRRTPGHDWCLIRLGLPGIVRGVVVDTAFFRGNYPSHFSLEGCALPGQPDVETLVAPTTRWIKMLQKTPLAGDSKNPFAVEAPYRFTHLRLNIYPDGGVARLRVHGEVLLDRTQPGAAGTVDLAAAENGACALSCSDMFFSSRHNLILPGPGLGMHDGWETRRRRGPGHDWVLIELATEGQVDRVEVDTSHFKGNFPESCSLEGWPAASAGGAAWDDAISPDSTRWRDILPKIKLQAHTRHLFDQSALLHIGPVTHVRFNIFPDGGVSRLRLHGRLTQNGELAAGLRRLNALSPEQAEEELSRCCGTAEWARRMAAGRPFATREALTSSADSIWGALGEKEWMEAFGRHPRIGEKQAAASEGPDTTAWAAQEQSGAEGAADETLSELTRANQEYEHRFGHVFLICATGKTAAEMLENLQERLGNMPEEEMRIAAEEQRKITALRLDKLLLA